MIRTYKDFEVYKRSYDMCIKMYRYAKTLPEDERYGLTSQIKRASTSIPLNIAEGYGKKSSAAEFKRFLIMALGSCNEMAVLLDICKDLEYMEENRYLEFIGEYEVIGKMLNNLIAKWK